MDADRITHLMRVMSTRPSRRAVARGLTALVAGSALTPLFGAETESAKKCRNSTQCPARTLCDQRRCRACTVCRSGCRYPNLETALEDSSGPAVVRYCAGTYRVNLSIERDVTLIGAGKGTGKGNTILDGGNDGRVFTIPGPWTVALRNLRITGGSATGAGEAGRGGGIYNGAELTLTDCVITGNQAHWGGGMHNFGTVRMTRCTVSDNKTVDEELIGGGITNHNSLTLVDSLVTNNHSEGDAGGIFNDHVSVTLDHSVVSENKAPNGIGGGIFNDNGKVTLINGSSITGNEANTEVEGTGGGIWNDSEPEWLDVSGGTITGNTPDDCAPEVNCPS